MMTAFVRTIILYFFIMVGLRLMGKRQIGELEPSELVMTMMISDLAAVPMQDFGIPLLSGLLPILTLLALSLLLSQLSLRSLRLRALICGTPTVLIRNGTLQQAAMRKNRYTLDELMEELREQGISRVEDVKYAVLENSGQLTVFPWAAQQPPTAEQLGRIAEQLAVKNRRARRIWKIAAGVLIAFAAVNLLLILLNFAAFRSFTTEAEITVENQAVPAAEASIQTS